MPNLELRRGPQPETIFGVKRFLAEDRRALENDGFKIYTVGKSLSELQAEGVTFWGAPKALFTDNQTSRSEVAVFPTGLYLAQTRQSPRLPNQRPLEESLGLLLLERDARLQEETTLLHEKHGTKHISVVRATIPISLELELAHAKENEGEGLLRPDYVLTDTPYTFRAGRDDAEVDLRLALARGRKKNEFLIQQVNPEELNINPVAYDTVVVVPINSFVEPTDDVFLSYTFATYHKKAA